MRGFPVWAIAVILMFAGLGARADVLSIRLVEATREAVGTSPRLADVADVLERNLPFASYTLEARSRVTLPAAETVRLGDYLVTCNGPAEELLLVVQRGNRTLISTVLRLRGSTPVIVGGFPSANGRRIIVLMVK